ncbi:MAG: DUF2793 domain-containing protein [Sphingomicrobium sp.]
MSATPRLVLPMIAAGQAQKELFHNEALQMLDVLVAAAVEGPPLASPPTTPVIGSCYLVAASPTGEWTGHAQQLAAYTSGGWRFIVARDGMGALVRSSGTTAVYRNGSWEIGTLSGSQVTIDGDKVVGARGSAIAAPTGGTVVDGEARATIGQLLIALRDHGLIEM